jgi:hypothetical protein
MNKICTKCLEEKNINAFDKNINKGYPNKNNSYRKICRSCRNKPKRDKFFSNEENIIKYRNYWKNWNKIKNEDILYRESRRLRGKIKYLLKCKTKSGDNIKKYIESLFDENMSWDNYGTYWNIDHINPIMDMLKNGKTENEINDFSNIRPLVIEEHQKRSRIY